MSWHALSILSEELIESQSHGVHAWVGRDTKTPEVPPLPPAGCSPAQAPRIQPWPGASPGLGQHSSRQCQHFSSSRERNPPCHLR